MSFENECFPDRVSIAQSCDSQYCQNQILYSHPIKNSKVTTKAICCEDHPPEEEGKEVYYWDTHADQVEERSKYIAKRRDVFLNLTSTSKKDCAPYIFDTSSSDYAHLHAHHQIALEENNEGRAPKLSLIIPTFGHATELKKVIKSLYPQKVSFELIIVATKKEEHILKRIMKDAPNCHLKLITLNFDRELGDFRYAAGHMRNIGALYSNSPRLLFMDSDILLPKNFLEIIRNSLENDDIVMPKRRHRKGPLTRLFTKVTEREKDQHWLNFYSDPTNWSDQSAPWQYVSTYTLGIKKDFFIKLGGFNPSFNSYGFEDVELGYRAYKHQASFKLLDISVRHIFHHKKRSEYNNDEDTRQKMLARSAQIFFRIHGDQEIYQKLKHYLSEPYHD